jgi:hypothetical protein
VKEVVADQTATTIATGAATMGRRKTVRKPLGTIWEIRNAPWHRIEEILKEFWPRKPTGRPPAH